MKSETSVKTAHQLARELLALPDVLVYHTDPSFIDACDQETDYTLGATIVELVDLPEWRFITICGDQPEDRDRVAIPHNLAFLQDVLLRDPVTQEPLQIIADSVNQKNGDFCLTVSSKDGTRTWKHTIHTEEV